MTELQESQFEKDFETFLDKGFAFISKNDGTISGAIDVLRERTFQKIQASGNPSSVSAFEISQNELVKAGALIPARTEAEHEAPAPFTLTVEEYRSIPTRVIAQKYRNQPEFKAAVDALIAAGKI